MVRAAISNYLRKLLNVDETPERIALSFSVGVFFAFSPFLGLHTFLGLLVAFLFGLNRAAVLVGVFVNNPWTLVPIYAAGTYLGGILVGFPHTGELPAFGWKQIWESRFWSQLGAQWRLIKPLFLGSSILAVFASILSYEMSRQLIIRGRAYRARKKDAML
jgi:uncharacterized protein